MANTDPFFLGSGYGNLYLDSLIWGGKWVDPGGGAPLVSYFFDDGFVPGYNRDGLPWTSEVEKDAFRLAVQLYQNVANIQFQEVASYEEADIAWYRVSSGDLGGNLGEHEPPSVSFLEPLWGFFNVEHPSWSDLRQGSYGFVTIIHELGHGLGLAHPHDGGDRPDATIFPGVSSPFFDYGTFNLNQGIWTTMSYNDGWNLAHPPEGEFAYGYQGTPMALDIAALQALYGPNLSYRTGDDTYVLPGVNASGTFWSCIWDAGGIDEISAAGIAGACTINLNEAPLVGSNAGGYVSRVAGILGGFTIANDVTIENATGGDGNDTLVGNPAANILDGGAGSDTMQGGAGNDTYKVDVATDVISELSGAGTDTVESKVSYILAANLENLVLIGAAALIGTGNAAANELTGNEFANTLDGMGGADKMTGGKGDDIYIVDTSADVVIETGGNGNDEVRSSVALNGAIAGIERYTFTGAAAVNFIAGAGNETIAGTAAADTLDGGGGVDSLKGGSGNDTYVVDSVGEAVDETSGSGIDTVLSEVSLALGAGLEHLTLTGSASISGTGNASNNSIVGNSGHNALSGLAGNDTLAGGTGADTLDGGTGSDRMTGGADNDVYVVDATTDVVTESAGGGTADTVKSSITLTLGLDVENLELQGSASLSATGNALANILVGNAANNVLDGKTGADTMRGGAGDDIYIVDDKAEAIEEPLGGGTDTVRSSVSLDVDLAANIEHLILTGAAAVGLGNGLDNVITGTTAGNTLTGRGGHDSLIGGGGNDTLTGDAGDDTLDGGAGADEFNPGAGNDVYVIDNVGDKIQPLLDDGVDTVEGTITFTLINQENLTLKGAAAINGTGNENSNVITGNAAANVLNGMSGVDTLIGGAGNDTYIADASSEKITELVNQGTDLVKSSASFTLPDHVENLTLTEADSVTGTGNTLNNLIAGNIGNNQLDGDGGNDTLSGGDGNDTLDGGAGNDSMAGGLGDDRYIVDSTTDRVTETSTAAGKDRVRSFESFTLGAYVEELELTGGKSINGTGNTLDNLLIGNAFANVLDGKTGADDMRGGAGDDVYVQDNLGDQMNEEGNTDSGDELRTNQAHSNALPGIEHYTFTGAKAIDFLADGAANRISGTALADTLDGLGEDDTLVGGSGNDLLVGDAAHDSLDGGAGADTMDGDEGNDTYVIDSASDKIVGGLDGSDTVRSSITYVLLAGLEHLVLIGAAAINGIGTSLDNQLTGNDSANVLDGGTGDDTMAGNKGNDTYKVDSSADQVIEVDNGGTDTVLSDKNYVLFDKNVENLTLLGTALAATGNESKNRLTGNDQNNQLDGAAGADTLVGGKGNDIYRVDVAQDIVTESSTLSTEIDTVQSTAPSYVLPAYVENLILLEGAGNGTGNTLANTITGNSGPNSLAGSAGNDVLAGNGGNDTLDGGTGTDTLEGGPGNDLYVQDSALDEIDEETSTDPGDELKTNQTLSNSSERPGIEHYTFTGSKAIDFDADDAANRITGTALADTLDGGAGNDTLSGGAGADSLVGGLGNDTYVVDNANDRLRDDVGVGIDTVQSSVSFDLTDDNPGPAGTVFGTLENLTLVGAGAISGTGNDAANVIIGNGAANTITGRGGNDTIDGGAGNDTIRYTSALDGHDVIDNFDANPAGGQDVLNLDALFDSLPVPAALRAARVSVAPPVGGSVEVSIDTNGIGGPDLTIVTINLSNPADQITVGQDIVVGT